MSRFAPLCLLLAGCNLPAKTVEKDVLDFAQIACILASDVSDSKLLAEACHVEHRLAPLIDALIEQRNQNRREGALRAQVGACR